MGDNAPEDCDATCLFAAATQSHLVMGGIGDGLLILRREEAPARWVIGPRGDAFLNDTAGMASDEGAAVGWHMETVELSRRQDWTVVLATDGVADDLRVDQIEGFVDWLVGRHVELSPKSRSAQLRRSLNDWPVPHHVDDKTLVVLTSVSKRRSQRSRSKKGSR